MSEDGRDCSPARLCQGLEDIVAKRRDRPYRSGRSPEVSGHKGSGMVERPPSLLTALRSA